MHEHEYVFSTVYEMVIHVLCTMEAYLTYYFCISLLLASRSHAMDDGLPLVLFRVLMKYLRDTQYDAKDWIWGTLKYHEEPW